MLTVRSPFARGVLVAAGIGLIVRALYAVFVTTDDGVVGDQIYYSAQAHLNATGHWFVQPFTADVPGADHPPLTSALLTPITWVFRNGSFVAAQRWFTVGIGLLNIGLIAAVARRVGGVRAGIIAAVLAAVHAAFWMGDALILSEPSAIAAVLGLLLAIGRLADDPTPRRAVVVGVLGGLVALGRAEMLLLLPLLMVPFLVERVRRVGWRPAALTAAIAVGTMAVVISPWVTWNVVRFEERALISTNDGFGLLGANCETTYYGDRIGSYDIGCALAPPIPPDFDPSQASKLRGDLAIDYARDHAGRLPLVAAARLARLWLVFDVRHEVAGGPGEGRPEPAMWVGVAQFWLLVPFAAFGFTRIARRDRWFLLAIPAVSTIAGALIAAYWRIRVPADLTLLIAAAIGIDQLRGAGWRFRPGPAEAETETRWLT